MANRREFIAAAGGLGMATLGGLNAAGSETQDSSNAQRDLYELRRYVIDNEPQKQGFDAFFRDAAIPALNRIGISPVGVFHSEKDLSPIYVLLRHRSTDSLLTSTQKLLADAEYLSKGAEFLNAPADKPAFQRVESSLLLAFKGMPTLDTPVSNSGRVVQLRTYESPSVKTGQKKIEMFNDAGEIAIFRRSGLHPVFFGESLVGCKDAQPDLYARLRERGPAQGQLGQVRLRPRLEEAQQDARILRQGNPLRHHQPDSQAHRVFTDLKRSRPCGGLASGSVCFSERVMPAWEIYTDNQPEQLGCRTIF